MFLLLGDLLDHAGWIDDGFSGYPRDPISSVQFRFWRDQDIVDQS
jgi:hypothetical protein